MNEAIPLLIVTGISECLTAPTYNLLLIHDTTTLYARTICGSIAFYCPHYILFFFNFMFYLFIPVYSFCCWPTQELISCLDVWPFGRLCVFD